MCKIGPTNQAYFKEELFCLVRLLARTTLICYSQDKDGGIAFFPPLPWLMQFSVVLDESLIIERNLQPSTEAATK